jgi:hypothetical protein
MSCRISASYSSEFPVRLPPSHSFTRVRPARLASFLDFLLTWSGFHRRLSGWQNTRSLSVRAPGGVAICALRWTWRCSGSNVPYRVLVLDWARPVRSTRR